MKINVHAIVIVQYSDEGGVGGGQEFCTDQLLLLEASPPRGHLLLLPGTIPPLGLLRASPKLVWV